jgi:hypothetical protein
MTPLPHAFESDTARRSTALADAEPALAPDRLPRSLCTADWDALLPALDAVLRDLRPDTGWLPRLLALRERSQQLADCGIDAALLHLVYTAGLDAQHYSSRHALLCAVVARETARALRWPAPRQASLALAALTMNAAMRGLQDQLATQQQPLSAAQRQVVAGHANRTADALSAAGVADTDWIEAVRLHHDDRCAAAPLATLSPVHQAARVLRRVDQFTAALSCRESRPPMSPVRAARVACLGHDGTPDEVGTALLQAVGVYPPGSAVRLASGESAIVLARGPRANLPEVALLTRPDGAPLAQPLRSGTHTLDRAVRAGLALADLRLLPSLRVLQAL